MPGVVCSSMRLGRLRSVGNRGKLPPSGEKPSCTSSARQADGREIHRRTRLVSTPVMSARLASSLMEIDRSGRRLRRSSSHRSREVRAHASGEKRIKTSLCRRGQTANRSAQECCGSGMSGQWVNLEGLEWSASGKPPMSVAGGRSVGRKSGQ